MKLKNTGSPLLELEWCSNQLTSRRRQLNFRATYLTAAYFILLSMVSFNIVIHAATDPSMKQKLRSSFVITIIRYYDFIEHL